MDPSSLRFRAYACGVDHRRIHELPDAASFIDAAILFVERWAGEADEVAVVVVEETTGERQCFRIDLDKGEVAPC